MNKKGQGVDPEYESKNQEIYSEIYKRMQEACEKGFLNNREAYLFLIHLRDNLEGCEKYFPEGFVFKTNNPLQYRSERPKSGDFFLLDMKTVRYWKKD